MRCFACGQELPEAGKPCPYCGTARCPRCSATSAGSQYCPDCGYPISPEIHAELSHLQYLLRDLDAALAAGETAVSLAALRTRYLERFNQLYTGSTGQTPTPSTVSTPPAPSPAIWPTTGTGAITRPLAPAVPAGASSRPIAPAVAPPWVDQIVVPSTTPSTPHQAFSSRALLADQAIALLSYLGGFLLLVATLLFVLYGRTVLPEGARLGTVLAVHLFFGVAGLALRRIDRLRIVGSIYIAVYVLSLPLVGLAIYRFILRGIGFPVAGTICIVAIYAAVVYLALGARLHFSLYAVSGLAALALALIAGLSWAGMGAWWWPAGLAIAAIGYLMLPGLPHLEPITPTAVTRPLAATALAGAELWTVTSLLSDQVSTLNSLVSPPADLHLAFLITTALLTIWGLVWWGQQRQPARGTLPAFFLIQLVLALLVWTEASYLADTWVLAALAILYVVAARLAEQAGWAGKLPRFLDTAGLLLALIAALPALTGPIYNLPLVAVLSIGVALSLAITIVRPAPWLLPIAGIFAGLTLAAGAPFIVGPELLTTADTPLYLGLTVLTAAASLAVARVKGRRWSAPLYFTTLMFFATTYLFSLADGPQGTALTLLVTAGLAYLIAIGAEVWALPIAYLLALAAIPYLGLAASWPVWLDLAAVGGLAALIAMLQLLWTIPLAANQHQTGLALHRWWSVAVATTGALVTAILPGSFAPQTALALTGTILLGETAALLAINAWLVWRWGLYITGLLATLAISWTMSYLGAMNAQAYILAPGAYLVFAGVLLSNNEHLTPPARTGIGQSLGTIGALLLTLTSLVQSFGDFPWLYTGVLAVEALLLVTIGLTARQRMVTLVSVILVGVAALRGVFIVAGVIPVWATFALLSVILLIGGGLLSWLRGHRRPNGMPQKPTPVGE